MLSSKKAIDVREYQTVVEKIANGNFSNVEPVGEGVSEYKLDWGPGYRIYFGQDGKTLVILLSGGFKKRQSKDINAAKDAWADYKKRKREEQKVKNKER